MRRIYIPTETPTDWASLLADPKKQWRTGFSAQSLAHSWEAAEGRFPPEVERLFSECEDETVHNLEMLLAFPEWKVYLPPRGHPSQNDLFVLARGQQGLVSIMVEGKVAEPFGETLATWLTPSTPGKVKRLEFIQYKLGLKGKLPEDIRYQLLHRATSAVLEAERFCTSGAVMLIHSFSPDCLWLEDFQAFLELFGNGSTVPGKLYKLTELSGRPLYSAWVIGNPEFLKA